MGLVLGNLRLPVMLLLASSTGVGRSSEHRGVRRRGLGGLDRPRARRADQLAAVRVDGPAVGGRRACGRLPVGEDLGVGAAPRDRGGAPLQRARPAQMERPARGAPADRPERSRLDIRAAVLSGLVIGLLGGLVGLILGALRMPALLKLVGEAPSRAVGTNLTVGVLVGDRRAGGAPAVAAPDWDLLAHRRRRLRARGAARRAAHGAALRAPARAGDRRGAARGGRGRGGAGRGRDRASRARTAHEQRGPAPAREPNSGQSATEVAPSREKP